MSISSEGAGGSPAPEPPASAPCPACGTPAFLLKVVEGHPILHCPGCGLQFCHPMPSAGELGAFYRAYRDPRAGLEVVEANARRNLDLFEREPGLRRDARILDFGCGTSRFVAVCRGQGYAESFGFDPHLPPDAAGPVLGWEACRARRWDLITLWGVLEHLTDPAAVLRDLAGLAAPGASLVLTTVCTETPIPYRHKPPEHTLYFSRRSLEHLARASGWRCAGIRDYVMVQDSGVYLSILLRTVPEAYRLRISHRLDRLVEVPTNEVLATFALDPEGVRSIG